MMGGEGPRRQHRRGESKAAFRVTRPLRSDARTPTGRRRRTPKTSTCSSSAPNATSEQLVVLSSRTGRRASPMPMVKPKTESTPRSRARPRPLCRSRLSTTARTARPHSTQTRSRAPSAPTFPCTVRGPCSRGAARGPPVAPAPQGRRCHMEAHRPDTPLQRADPGIAMPPRGPIGLTPRAGQPMPQGSAGRVLVTETIPVNQLVAVHLLEQRGIPPSTPRQRRTRSHVMHAHKHHDAIFMGLPTPGDQSANTTRHRRSPPRRTKRHTPISRGPQARFRATGTVPSPRAGLTTSANRSSHRTRPHHGPSPPRQARSEPHQAGSLLTGAGGVGTAISVAAGLSSEKRVTRRRQIALRGRRMRSAATGPVIAATPAIRPQPPRRSRPYNTQS